MTYIGSNTWRNIRSFADVEQELGDRDRRKVGNNTYLIRRAPGEIALRLHHTDILTFTPDCVVYDSDGWRTVTTKARMNAWGPARIHQRDWEWYIGDRIFWDGQVVGYDGEMIDDIDTIAAD